MSPAAAARLTLVVLTAASALAGADASAGDQRYRLVVTFGSHGQGTAHAAAQKLDALVERYGGEKKVGLHRVDWGKEGEHDECMTLDRLSDAERAAFVAAVKKDVQGRTVTLRENTTCRGGSVHYPDADRRHTAAPLKTAAQAIAAFQRAWDDQVAPARNAEMAANGHPEGDGLDAKIHGPGLRATRGPCARTQALVAEKGRFVSLWGSPDALAGRDACWVVSVQAHAFWHVEGALDAATGDLLVVVRTVEG